MKKQKGKNLAVIGTICSCGPLFGLIGTVVIMLSAFQTMESGSEVSPEALANDIGIHLISTTIGLCLGAIGLILILIALFGSKYRAPWFFGVLCALSVLWMIGFPIGTIAGVALLVYLLKHKAEFKDKQSPNTALTPSLAPPAQSDAGRWGSINIRDKNHSKIGVASFVLALISVFGMCASLAYAVYLKATSIDEIPFIPNLIVVIGGLIFFCLCLIAIGMGIAGIVQKKRRRNFAIIGLLISGVELLSLAGLFLLGLS